MNISILGLNSNLINIDKQNKLINLIKSKIYEIGESVSLISYFDNDLQNLQNIFNKDYNIVFIIGTSSTNYNHSIKNNLARIFNDKLTNLELSYSSLNKYCSDNNIPFSVEEEMEILLPSNSIPLCDDKYYYNGFMYKHNETYVIFIPDNIMFFNICYDKYIKPLLIDLIDCNYRQQVLKCFGLSEKDLKAQLSEFLSNPDISIQIVGNELDYAIFIKYSNSNNKVHETISNIVSKLNKFIYATDNVTLFEMATELLKVQNKTLTIAETITYGELTKKLSKHNPTIITSSYLFTNYNSIINTTGIDSKVLDKFGKYSVNTVYELNNLLLEKTTSKLSLFILANPQNIDYSYIAIGDLEGIHVYKNKLDKNDDNLIDNLTKIATFYLIKKLKQNDLSF